MFTSFFAVASLLAAAAAGPLVIKDPAPFTTVRAGQNTVIDLDVTVSDTHTVSWCLTHRCMRTA